MKRTNLLRLGFISSIVFFCSIQPVITQQTYAFISSSGEINYGISTSLDTYYGFVCSDGDFFSGRYTPEHFQKIKQGGFNVILITTWWGRLESEVGVLNEARLEALRNGVKMAREAGLNVIMSFRVCYDPNLIESWWSEWSSGPTHDFVNLSEKGRTRYANFIEKMVQQFPDCMYCLWHFPYHKQEADAARRNAFYGTTFPTLLNAVRKHSNNSVVFVPIYQGATKNGETSDYYLTATPYKDSNIIYGLSHMIPWSVIDSGSWGPAITDQYGPLTFERMDSAFEGIKRWKETYNLPMLSVEYGSLRWNGSIEQSRLDCLEASLQRMKNYNVGWTYYRIWLLLLGSGNNVLTNIKNFECNPDLLNLFQKYS